MSSEIAIIAPRNLEESERLAATLAKSMLLPTDLKGKPSDVLAIILTGAELGLAPMQAVRGIQVIKGKPSLSADLMAALCKRRRDVCEYLTPVTLTAEKAVYETKRVGDPKPTTMEFTIQDAQRAGLAGSDTYRKFPQAMLKARCLSAICRAVYPDVCMGLYDPDEVANIDTPVLPLVEKDITPVDQPVRMVANANVEQPKTKALAEKVAARMQSKMTIIDLPPDPKPEPLPDDPYGSGKPLSDCTDAQLTNRKKDLMGGKWPAKKKAEAQAKLEAVLAEEERRMKPEPPPIASQPELEPSEDSVPF
jgi:hypothetical protein